MRIEAPEHFRAWRETPHLIRFQNGESLRDLVAHTADALRFVLERHADQTVVLVSHESANKALLLQLLDQPLSAYWRLAQDPCAINVIEIEGLTVRVRRVNDTHHLLRP